MLPFGAAYSHRLRPVPGPEALNESLRILVVYPDVEVCIVMARVVEGIEITTFVFERVPQPFD